MYSRIVQKHLLYGCSFPKTKLVFVLYGFSMRAIYSPLNAIKGPLNFLFVPNAEKLLRRLGSPLTVN